VKERVLAAMLSSGKGYSLKRGILAGDAVLIAPVPTQFPAISEFYRNFAILRLPGQIS